MTYYHPCLMHKKWAHHRLHYQCHSRKRAYPCLGSQIPIDGWRYRYDAPAHFPSRWNASCLSWENYHRGVRDYSPRKTPPRWSVLSPRSRKVSFLFADDIGRMENLFLEMGTAWEIYFQKDQGMSCLPVPSLHILP